MATATAPPAGLAAISRAVVSAAAELVVSVERAVVGEDNVRTARGNAWAAIQADRARAQARDEMDALVRTLLTTRTAGPAPATTPKSAASSERRPAARPASALTTAR
jgi:hypothetical protein